MHDLAQQDEAAMGRPGTPGVNAALRVAGVVKRYGTHVALDGVSFELRPGTFTALLGPNGAGKSTLFQVLTGLFAADAGDVVVGGVELRRSPAAALRQIGVVFQQSSLDLDLSVQRNLRFHCALHGLPAALARQRIEQAAEQLGIGAELARPARELSGGTRRKVELARALLHRPALLLMDEPTVGLDPKSRRDLLRSLREDVRTRGSSVLWATHLVEEAEDADRVLVLHRGRLLADAAPADVTRALGGSTLEESFLRATA
jgi:ABC-2 type transport system ATP-binding protein